MTDDQLDARLRAAGERWRSANTTVSTATRPDTSTTQDLAVAPSRPRTPRRHWGLLASAAAVAAALVVGGAFVLHGSNDPAPSGDTAALEGHVWLLQDPERGANSNASLYVDRDGNLVADDECRLIGASLAIDGDRITAGAPVVRYKSCTDQYGVGFYDAGTAVLTGSSTYALTADGLTLTTEHTTLHFTLAPNATPIPTLNVPTIVGQDWALVSGKDADGNAVPVAGDPVFHLGDDGTLTGSDGCNTAGGHVTVDGGALDFGAGVGGTETYCPGDRGATETAVMAMYAGKVDALATGGTLTLTKGKAELVYRWAPPSSAATDQDVLNGGTWHTADGASVTVVGGSLTYARDCGTFTAPVTVFPGVLQLGDLGGVANDCPETFLHSLLTTGSVVWSIRNGALVLGDGGSQAAGVVLTRAAAPPTGAQLIGPTWQVDTITTATDARYRNGAPSPDPASVTFSDSGFVARHMCYSLTGNAAVSGDSLTFSDPKVGQALPCPFVSGRDKAASLIDAVLDSSATWTVDGDRLRLRANGITLQLTTGSGSTQDDPLVGTDWRLETTVTDSGEREADNQQLSFTDSAVTASDGLNPISGPVAIGSDTLHLGDLSVGAVGSTEPDPVREIIDSVLQKGDVGWVVDGDVLTLSSGLTQLIYRAHTATSDSIVGAWTLTTIEHSTGPDGTASPPSSAVVLTVASTAVVLGGTSAAASFDASTITFGGWVDGVVAHNPLELSGSESDFAINQVLNGACTYVIRDNTLTITQDGVGALVFSRA